MWDLRTEKETLTLRGHTHFVSSLVLSIDGKRNFFSEGVDNTIKVWDLEADKETLTLRVGHEGATGLPSNLALTAC